jgi:hypothetical protein
VVSITSRLCATQARSWRVTIRLSRAMKTVTAARITKSEIGGASVRQRDGGARRPGGGPMVTLDCSPAGVGSVYPNSAADKAPRGKPAQAAP